MSHKNSVLQEWVTGLPLMMQGTLMTCVRGPDTRSCPKMKPVWRWMRSLLLVNGNHENDFMDVTSFPPVEEFEDELEYLTLHAFLHLLHSLEIVAYRHPDEGTRDIAFDYYARFADFLHLYPEPPDEMKERLSGRPGTTGSSRRWERQEPFPGNAPFVRVVERTVEVDRDLPDVPLHQVHGNGGS